MQRHMIRWTTLLLTLLLVSGCGYNALQIMKAGRRSSEVMVMRYCRDIFAHEGAIAKRRAGRV